MANTVIQLKNSGASGNIPNALAPGELAINYADGKLYYGNASNTAILFDAVTEPAGLNQELQFNNSGIFGSSAKLKFDSANSELSVNAKISVLSSSGDEGGEIFLARPQSNTTLNGGVTIDVYQNRIRFFEQGGSARGAYIDLTQANTGADSNLLTGGAGGTIDTVARDIAALAYNAANSAVTSGEANVGAGLITTKANYEANVGIGLIDTRTNYEANVGAGLISVTNAYQANVGAVSINLNNEILNREANVGAGLLSTKSAYEANVGYSIIQEQANVGAGLISVTNAYQANVGAGLLSVINSYEANVGAGLITVTSAYQANVGAARIDANTANATLAASILSGRTADNANLGASIINVTNAYQANVGAGLITVTGAYQANVGVEVAARQANVGAGLITVTSAYQANVGAARIIALGRADSAFAQANLAFDAANSKVSSSGGTIFGDLSVTGNLTITGNTTTINVTSLSITDTIIQLGIENLNDTLDIGFVGHYANTPNNHTGLVRRAADGKYYLFDNFLTDEPGNIIDFANTRVATLSANLITNVITLRGLDPLDYANTIYSNAQANTGASVISLNNQINNAFNQANLAYNAANSAGGVSNAFNQANLAYNAANSAVTTGQANVGAGLISLSTSLTSAYQANVGAGLISLSTSLTSAYQANVGAGLISAINTGQANVGAGLITTKSNYEANVGVAVISGQANVGAGLIAYQITSQANVGAGLITSAGNINATDDTSTAASFYPVIVGALGSLQTAKGSSTKFYFNPSTGTLNATIFNSLSDISSKQNIQTIENSLEKVLQLRGVSFEWIDNKNKSIGVIAQEVEKILPEVVSENENRIKSVSYDSIIALLIEAIKEQQKQIDELKHIIRGGKQ
jgi:hypothetical protein